MILELDALDVRHVDHAQREDGRPHPIRFDEVLEGRVNVEQHPFVAAIFAARERQRLVRLRRLAPDHHRSLFGRKPGQRSADDLVRAPGHVGVAGHDGDPVRGGSLDAPLHEQDGGQRASHERRAEQDDQHGDGRDARQHDAPAPQRRFLGPPHGIRQCAPLERLLHETPHQRR